MATTGDSAAVAMQHLISRWITLATMGNNIESVYTDDKLIRTRYTGSLSPMDSLTVTRFFADGVILARVEPKPVD
jgi:hypothetical protein